ncbi:MAG: hypothetical protein AAB066_05300 [Candidatus Margulisiibacteriota bacterium]
MPKQVRNGFTLVEFLTATMILLPLVTLLVRMVPGLLMSGHYSQAASHCTFLANQKLDEIRKLAYSANPSYGFGIDYSQTPTAYPSPFQTYAFTITDDHDLERKTIVVTAWEDRDQNLGLGANEISVVHSRLLSRRQ